MEAATEPQAHFIGVNFAEPTVRSLNMGVVAFTLEYLVTCAHDLLNSLPIQMKFVSKIKSETAHGTLHSPSAKAIANNSSDSLIDLFKAFEHPDAIYILCS